MSAHAARRHGTANNVVMSHFDNTNMEADTEAASNIATSNAHRYSMAFVALGILNNAPYVIMLACAKNISEGGTALVYLVNVMPGFLVKLSAPYWFHKVSYQTRIRVAALAMCLAFIMVGTALNNNNASSLYTSLWGVALISFQCSLGEASLLALAGSVDKISYFAAGTGWAGPLGFAYKVILKHYLSWRVTLYLAVPLLGISYERIYSIYCNDSIQQQAYTIVDTSETTTDIDDQVELAKHDNLSQSRQLQSHQHYNTSLTADELTNETNDHANITATTGSITNPTIIPPDQMTTVQKFYFVASLWRFMIPLWLVYAAEYACQSGTWTATGLEADARMQFYTFANWLYQAGVLVSRSSGNCFSVNMVGLWIMPILQCTHLVYFTLAAAGYYYSNLTILYTLAFITGLYGGAVYVHGYNLICKTVPPVQKEMALASVSAAEGAGVMVADVLGLFLQSCLYKVNDIAGAIVQCPIKV